MRRGLAAPAWKPLFWHFLYEQRLRYFLVLIWKKSAYIKPFKYSTATQMEQNNPRALAPLLKNATENI